MLWTDDHQEIEVSCNTNIQKIDSIGELHDFVSSSIEPFKRRISPYKAMALSLSVTQSILKTFHEDPKRAESFCRYLTERGLYVSSLDTRFVPYHKRDRKQQLYHPNWLQDDRVRFTKWSGELLVKLMDRTEVGTIQTFAGVFHEEEGSSEDVKKAFTGALLRLVFHFHQLQRQHGKRIVICLKPAPFFTFENISTLLSFYSDQLFEEGTKQLREAFGFSADDAEEMIKNHVGICFDIGQLAATYHDPLSRIKQIQQSDLTTCVQISSSPVLFSPDNNQEGQDRFFRVNQGRYLFPVSGRKEEGEKCYLDDVSKLCGERLKEWQSYAEWRAVNPLPLFLDQVKSLFTTQEYVDDFLDRVLPGDIPFQKLEIETRSWEFLPQEVRRNEGITDVTDVMVKNVAWLQERFAKHDYQRK